jgi:UDP-2,3-diacylglucosamine hydrolase
MVGWANMKTLFISDIHLDTAGSPLTNALFQFLDTVAPESQSLYILGDLFESYVGDDENSLLHQELAAKLASLSREGISIYLLNGNRDFLVGKAFTDRCNATLLADPTLIDLYGTPTLLLHGDSLCTLDKSYQRMRRLFHNPLFQFLALKLPLRWRLKVAESMRDNSQQMVQTKSYAMMDTVQETVMQMLKQNKVTHMIHGHTHRPATHHFALNNNTVGERIVLGAWDKSGACYLEATPEGTELKKFVIS